MSKNGSPPRSSAPQRKGHPLLAGILIGMVAGLLVAGGMAWYILKTPSPFVNNVPHEQVKLEPDAPKPPPPRPAQAASAPAAAPESAQAASGVGDDKPRFEFYKVLTDGKTDQAAPATKPARPAANEAKPATRETFYLQAGAFADAEDADRLKAKLAMLGVEAAVLDATLPDKTAWHRVRLGPYGSAEEMNKVSAMLKQNGINATPMRSQ